MQNMILVIISSLVLSIFHFSAIKAAENETSCDPEPTNMTMTFGDNTFCSISPVGDSDLFTFNGMAGEVVTLTVQRRSFGGFFVNLELFDPSQALIETFGAGETKDIILAQTGTYLVRITESDNDQTGNYNISLERLFPISPNTISICYGCVNQSVINAVGDIDFFIFEGLAGDTVNLTLQRLDFGGFFVELELFDPSQALIETFGAGETKDIILAQTGTYLVRITEFADDQTGNYNLALQCLFGTCFNQPDISVSPTSFNFGNIDIGFASAPQSLTISNDGDRNLIISTITPPSAFGIVNDNCSGQTIPPATSCTLGIVFAPAGPGAATPMLTIFSNDPDTPAFDVALSGDGNGGTVFGASVTTVEPNVVLCRNLTTAQSERLVTPGRSWDCEAAGLTLNSGDEVLTAIRGVAD